MNDMRTAAVAMHELLTSYLQAGFTRPEAMQLVMTQLAALVKDSK